jgi:hypothetical protein
MVNLTDPHIDRLEDGHASRCRTWKTHHSKLTLDMDRMCGKQLDCRTRRIFRACTLPDASAVSMLDLPSYVHLCVEELSMCMDY